MAVAFNPSEEVREGGNHHHHHHHHHQQQLQQQQQATQHANSANATVQESSSESSSASSSQSASPSSSTNSSPGAVSGHMPIPQAQIPHPNVPVYYYPAGSPLVPPHSPVPPTATVYRQYNNEELIQAICEALHRCSNGSLPPPSPSCSPFTPSNVPLTPYAVYGQSSSASQGETNVFFPQNMPTTPHAYYTHPQQPPQSPMSSQPSYYSMPQQQPLFFQYHTVQPTYSTAAPSSTSSPAANTSTFPSSAAITPQLQPIPRRAARRIRLSSRSEASPSSSHRNPAESSESDADPVLPHDINNHTAIVDANNNSSDSDHHLHDHLTYLEARERLEEFPGRVPQRRKKSLSVSSSPSTSKKAEMMIPTEVTGSGSVVITSQKQQPRQINNQTSIKDSTTEPLLAASTNRGSSRGTSSRNTSTGKTKEHCFNWSLVTAFVLVVGCGFFASR